MFTSKFKKNKMVLSPVSLAFLIVAVSCGKSKQGPEPKKPVEEIFYTNPVFEPILADPSVVRDPKTGYFYAIGTEDNWGDGKGNRLMPLVRSENLVDWVSVGNAFTRKPTWKSNGGLWAGDLNLINDQYYLYYSYSTWGDANPGVGLAIASSPAGPYTDRGKLFTSQEIGVPNSIDPFFYEEDGQKYLFWGSFSSAATQGTYGVPLSDDGRSVPDLSKKFKVAAGDWEAVMIHKRDGYYYFFGSKGSCCNGANSQYHVLVGRSTNLRGPYVDKKGEDIRVRGKGTLLLQGNDIVAGPGHNAGLVTDDEGTDWLLYHGILRTQGTVSSGASRRTLMLDKITWNNGWPEIAGNSPSTTRQRGPAFFKK